MVKFSSARFLPLKFDSALNLRKKFEKDHSRLRNRIKFTPHQNNFKERQCRAILVYRRAIKAAQDAKIYPSDTNRTVAYKEAK